MSRVKDAVATAGAVMTLLGIVGVVAMIPATLEIGAFTDVVLWSAGISAGTALLGWVLFLLADK